MKHYVGERTPEGCQVDVIDRDAPSGGYPLSPRLDLHNHSPTGFEWGFGGSGPAQLALALLADALGNDDRALKCYQDFKFKVVGRLEDDRWELSQEDILQTVASIESARSPQKKGSVTAIKFQPGNVVTTLGALEVASHAQIASLLNRHLRGDWGEVDTADAKANEQALKHGERLLSAYTVNGEKLWVLTEADRSSTTVMTPGEY